MSFEPKDFATLALSAAALGLSLSNLVKGRLDANALNQRTFEQKRFEAVTVAEEVKTSLAQIEGELGTLRFEGLRANDLSVVEAAEEHLKRAEARRSSFASTSEELRALTSSSDSRGDLLAIEKIVGGLKAHKASVSEYGRLISNFVEDGRRVILVRAAVLDESSMRPPSVRAEDASRPDQSL
jgi:hypothetical protein